MNCPKECRRPIRKVDGDHASTLYIKLRPFLRVIASWGCYVPIRRNRRKHEDWPLHDWDGPGRSPLCVEWGNQSRPGPMPTFAQFCRVYRLESVES